MAKKSTQKTVTKKTAKPAKSPAKKTVVKKTIKKVTTKKPVKKVVSKKVTKKVTPKKVVSKKVTKKVTPKKPVKKVVAKKVIKKVAPKKLVKKVVAKKVIKKVAPKKVVAKKTIKKAVVKKVTKKVVPKKVISKKPVKKVLVKKTVKKVISKVAVSKKVFKPAKKIEFKPVSRKDDKLITKKSEVKYPEIEIIEPKKTDHVKHVTVTIDKTSQERKPTPAKDIVFPSSANQPMQYEVVESKRYSDADLAEFKELINKKIAVAREELSNLISQMQNPGLNASAETDNSYKTLEDGASTAEKEYISQLAVRQRKFIENLENALVRIENKTYGICKVTGKLISKERLRAVPHTTLSMEAKMQQYK